ncbi:NAD(P)-dependent dehydrogenase (short-subunit alcohol dehydrogenase family) [Rhizobium sp. BK529]|uniref:SDR family NAD(P)-dependent oxidoreductase n=1 Tax=unclassified Rhizobium TaxID=2613769 RepID=UPI0010439006|nr:MULTISPECIES: SDR family oxidoreductase [unclassified Rhizobium]MBB3593896.1 NAD(P)-dependent dehydrogenase (short-subunit alcohol dehydrogenase family) [Rhizobium sp. BK529]TCS01353.1 NAD(P)-dependent dehydrogenase (short-subunit alcohol dehydrogenase family) [Rhizobium sp. BK418]
MSVLNGKVAFVTGGSRGIGAAIAKRLAADGARVVLTYVNGVEAAAGVVRAIEAAGGMALAVRADASDAVDVEAAVATAAETFGRIDILVNNAGIFQAAPIETLSLDDFDATFSINVRSAFVASKAALAFMPDGGRIISIGSNLAVRATSPGLSLYTASKAAIAGLSQALARELGPRRITVNTVHPGSTDTDMNPADGPHAGEQKGRMSNPAGFADPGEIADVVAYLASPAARSVTGAAWTVDNGANA